jgi:hypothetical protein
MLNLLLNAKQIYVGFLSVIILGFAFYGHPWLMLSILAVAVALCVPIAWWAAPKKTPRPKNCDDTELTAARTRRWSGWQ